MSKPWLAWLMALAAARASAQEPRADEAVPAQRADSTGERTFFPELTRSDVHGYLWTRYRLRATYHESDQDLDQSILVDIGDPQRHGLTLSLLGQWSADLDGRRNPSAFASLEDTFEERVNGRLLRAYADLNRVGPIERVRFGRQEITYLAEVPAFDGVSAETLAITGANLRFDVFAGVPTHLFESSPRGDSIFGAGVQADPWDGTSAALHVARITDSLVLDTERNAFVALEASQRLVQHVTLSGRATSVDGEARDLTLRAAYANADNGWRGEASYFTLLETQRHLVTELDPFFSLLTEEDAYHEWRVLASKELSEQWLIEGGIWVRELWHETDEGAFNHEYRRYYVTPTLRDWPLDRTDLSLTAELWESETQVVDTYGVDLAHDLSDDLRVEVGSEYALFKFDPFFGAEREDVHTYYLRGKYDITASLRVDADLDLESDAQDTYQTLRLWLRWRF